MFETISEWDNLMNWHVSFIVSSIGISCEFIVLNRIATCMCFTLIGCAYR